LEVNKLTKKSDSGNTKLFTGILVVALLVVGGYLIFGGNGNQASTASFVAPATASIGGGGQVNVVVAPQQPGAANTYHSGTATLKPKAADGTNGQSSSMLFLHSSEARDVNGNPMFDTKGNQLSSAAFSEEKTRYSIMKKMQVGGAVSNPDIKYFSGEAIDAVSSGAWAHTINANEKDKFVAYTYVASGTTYSAPIHGINISTAKLLVLTGWNDPNQNWIINQWDGSSPDWKIKIYPNLTFTDDTGVRRDNYTVGDSGTVKTKQNFNFYINATDVGEDATAADVGLFLTAPKNISTKFSGLTLSPRATNGQGTLTINSLDTTYQDQDGSVAQAASLLTGNVTTFNDQLFYLGQIPSDWITEKTSTDRNQISGVFTTDTYGTPVTGTIWIVQNVHAKGVQNGAFVNAKWFNLQFSANGNTGYDKAP